MRPCIVRVTVEHKLRYGTYTEQSQRRGDCVPARNLRRRPDSNSKLVDLASSLSSGSNEIVGDSVRGTHRGRLSTVEIEPRGRERANYVSSSSSRPWKFQFHVSHLHIQGNRESHHDSQRGSNSATNDRDDSCLGLLARFARFEGCCLACYPRPIKHLTVKLREAIRVSV